LGLDVHEFEKFGKPGSLIVWATALTQVVAVVVQGKSLISALYGITGAELSKHILRVKRTRKEYCSKKNLKSNARKTMGEFIVLDGLTTAPTSVPGERQVRDYVAKDVPLAVADTAGRALRCLPPSLLSCSCSCSLSLSLSLQQLLTQIQITLAHS
ncbi:MAG TPA: hypothetical protein V6D20_20710, partial [Candidatus Obscuribacterales bacterium]